MSEPAVSIIIVNYNTCALTAQCIDSVFDCTHGIEFEVILVDNHSTDNSREVFSSDQRIRYVYCFENLGFGRANNLGMFLARGEYVFLLNSDTILLNNAVKLLYDIAASRPEPAFYGTWLLDADRRIALSYADIPTACNMLRDMVDRYIFRLKGGNRQLQYQQDYESSTDIRRVGYISGADIFVRRDIVERYGGFDSKIFMYYEESDWQRRLGCQGVYSYIVKGPKIVHLQGASTNGKRRSVRGLLMQLRGRYYYVRKHNNLLQYLAFRILYLIVSIPYALTLGGYSWADRLRYLWALIR